MLTDPPVTHVQHQSSPVLDALFCKCRQGSCMAHCCRSLLPLHPRCSLLQAVPDLSGRQALTASMQRALLLRWAAQCSCNKIALGDNALRMATRTIAMTSQGAGYALPGCIHYIDARWAQAEQLLPRGAVPCTGWVVTLT